MKKAYSSRMFSPVPDKITDSIFIDYSEEQLREKLAGQTKEQVKEYSDYLKKFIGENKPRLADLEAALDARRPLVKIAKTQIRQHSSLLDDIDRLGRELGIDNLVNKNPPMIQEFEKAEKQYVTLCNSITVAEKHLGFINNIVEEHKPGCVLS